ncbi:cellulase family glycosylhydrolase [Ruminococcus sp.]|uniref:cellulase family glycosylhydrolase n=1 Tax=Ruminococcus sp. TaxID=41978 RepID=UPI0025DDAF7A|nr:cellulase family glycosylhydrolase [Ruminococcus sp.]
MNKLIKKGCSALIAAITLATSLSSFSNHLESDKSSAAALKINSVFNESNVVNAGSYTIPELNIPAKNIPDTEGINFVKDMRLGWNLGNTLDAIDDTGWVGSEMGIETCWNGGYKTSKEMIDAVKAAGFRTVRIPVSWHNHVDGSYNITKQWMDRVQEVVDYAIDDDMYVILNVHHDNDQKYMYPDSAHYQQSKNYMTTIWSQIADRFKDYDSKLIFETMNEPRLVGHQNEWWINPSNGDCIDAIKTINKLNQDILDTIRSSGGNNNSRYVAIPGYDCSVDGATNENFKLPNDKTQNRLIVAVHAYLPYGFALAEESDSQSVNYFNINTDTGEIQQALDKVYNQYVSKGIPVYIGEYGARDKGGNVQPRIDCAAYFTAFASSRGITCCWWDDISFMLLDRSNCTWKQPEIVQAINKYARGDTQSTIVTTVSKPVITTTTTTTVPISDSSKFYGKKSSDGIVDFGNPIGNNAFVEVKFDSNTNFMNGCLGFSPSIDGKNYWVAYVWETKKSDTISIDINSPKQIMDVSSTEAVAVTDEDTIVKLISYIKEQKSAILQAWYASDKSGKQIDPAESGAKSLEAFIVISENQIESTTLSSQTSTTTTTITTSTTSSAVTTTINTTTTVDTDIIMYGDSNCDGQIDLADAVLIMQSLANPSRYGINGTDEKHITELGLKNADCYMTGDGVTNNDAATIQKLCLNILEKLPVV